MAGCTLRIQLVRISRLELLATALMGLVVAVWQLEHVLVGLVLVVLWEDSRVVVVEGEEEEDVVGEGVVEEEGVVVVVGE